MRRKPLISPSRYRQAAPASNRALSPFLPQGEAGGMREREAGQLRSAMSRVSLAPANRTPQPDRHPAPGARGRRCSSRRRSLRFRGRDAARAEFPNSFWAVAGSLGPKPASRGHREARPSRMQGARGVRTQELPSSQRLEPASKVSIRVRKADAKNGLQLIFVAAIRREYS